METQRGRNEAVTGNKVEVRKETLDEEEEGTGKRKTRRMKSKWTVRAKGDDGGDTGREAMRVTKKK